MYKFTHTRRNPRGMNMLVVSPIADLFDGSSPTSNWKSHAWKDRPAGVKQIRAKTKSISQTFSFECITTYRLQCLPNIYDTVACNFDLLFLHVIVARFKRVALQAESVLKESSAKC